MHFNLLPWFSCAQVCLCSYLDGQLFDDVIPEIQLLERSETRHTSRDVLDQVVRHVEALEFNLQCACIHGATLGARIQEQEDTFGLQLSPMRC